MVGDDEGIAPSGGDTDRSSILSFLSTIGSFFFPRLSPRSALFASTSVSRSCLRNQTTVIHAKAPSQVVCMYYPLCLYNGLNTGRMRSLHVNHHSGMSLPLYRSKALRVNILRNQALNERDESINRECMSIETIGRPFAVSCSRATHHLRDELMAEVQAFQETSANQPVSSSASGYRTEKAQFKVD